jgi:hypothetical protein
MKIATLAALTTALCLALAAPAMADSIAYIKDGNVWLATPDGGRQVQITTSGDYSYVSQADDGTMIALAPNERLRKLSRTGQVLAEFPVYVGDGAPRSGPVNEFHGPFTPEISPDGRLVAFEWIDESYGNGDTEDCNPNSVPPCYVFTAGRGVGITHSDRFTGYEEFGLITGWIFPHWVSNDMLLRSESGVSMNEDAVFTSVGPGKGDDGLKRWFWDDWGYGVSDVEMSRDLKTVVGIAGQNDEKLRVYRPLYDPFNAPAQNLTPFAENTPVVEPCFELGDPVGGRFETPSLSPDGRGLAYAVGDGIWVHPLPDLSAGCQNGQLGRLVIPGGRHPDWGPADVRSHTRVRDKLRVKAARTSLRVTLRRGLMLTVQGSGAGRATATALSGRNRVGTGRARASAAGTARVKIRFTRAAKRSLSRRRSVRLTLNVRFRPNTGPASARQVSLRLAR